MEELNEWREAGKAIGVKLGVIQERERIMRLLVEHQVIRRDALGSLVFVNCDTMAVEYLPEVLAEGWKE